MTGLSQKLNQPFASVFRREFLKAKGARLRNIVKDVVKSNPKLSKEKVKQEIRIIKKFNNGRVITNQITKKAIGYIDNDPQAMKGKFHHHEARAISQIQHEQHKMDVAERNAKAEEVKKSALASVRTRQDAQEEQAVSRNTNTGAHKDAVSSVSKLNHPLTSVSTSNKSPSSIHQLMTEREKATSKEHKNEEPAPIVDMMLD